MSAGDMPDVPDILESSRRIAALAEEVRAREDQLALDAMAASNDSDAAVAIAIIVSFFVIVLSLGSLFWAMVDAEGQGEAGSAPYEASSKPSVSFNPFHTAQPPAGAVHTHRLSRTLDDVLQLQCAEGWSALRAFIGRMPSSEDDRRTFFSTLPRVVAKVFGLEGSGWTRDVQRAEDRLALLELLMPPPPPELAADALTAAGWGADGLANGSPGGGGAPGGGGGGVGGGERSAERGLGRSPALFGLADPASASPFGRAPTTPSRSAGAAGASAAARAAAASGGGGSGGSGGARGAHGGAPRMPGALFELLFAPRGLAEQHARRYTFFVRKLPAPMVAAIERRALHALPPLVRRKVEEASAALERGVGGGRHALGSPGGGGAPWASPLGAAGAAHPLGGGGFGGGGGGLGGAPPPLLPQGQQQGPGAAAMPAELTLSAREYFLFHMCAAASENASALYTEACYAAPYSAALGEGGGASAERRSAQRVSALALPGVHLGGGGAAEKRRRPVSLYVQLVRAYLDFFVPGAEHADGGGGGGGVCSAGTPAGGGNVRATRRGAAAAGGASGGGGGACTPSSIGCAASLGSPAAGPTPAAPAATDASIAHRRMLCDEFLAVCVAFWCHAPPASEDQRTSAFPRLAASSAASAAAVGAGAAGADGPHIESVDCVELLADHVSAGLRAGVRAHAAAHGPARGLLGQWLYQCALGGAVGGGARGYAPRGFAPPALAPSPAPYELLSDKLYRWVLAGMLRLPPGSRRYPRVLGVWLAYALPWGGFAASRALGGGVGGEANRERRRHAPTPGSARARRAGDGSAARAPPTPDAPAGAAGGGAAARRAAAALEGDEAGHWMEFITGHWLLILRPLIELLADPAGQLDLNSAAAPELLSAVLSACAQPSLLRALQRVSAATRARALAGAAAGVAPGGAALDALSPAELDLALKFALHLEGDGWELACREVHTARLADAADALSERIERKLHELRTDGRAASVAGRVVHDVVSSLQHGSAAASRAALIPKLSAVQEQLGAMLATLGAGTRIGRQHSTDGGGARAPVSPAALRYRHSGALTPAGREALLSGAARADAARVAYRATPTTPRRPISADEVAPLARMAERAALLLRGPAARALGSWLPPALAAGVERGADALRPRALASRRVLVALGGVLALLAAPPPLHARRWVLWLWRLSLLWCVFVSAMLCKQAGVLQLEPPSPGAAYTPSAAELLDQAQWVCWARAELKRGAPYGELEARLAAELAGLVGARAAEGVAADVLSRASGATTEGEERLAGRYDY